MFLFSCTPECENFINALKLSIYNYFKYVSFGERERAHNLKDISKRSTTSNHLKATLLNLH